MFRILFVFFIIIPIIEISVIMQVGALIGPWPTVAIVILTAWFGAKKVREQGLATLTSVQTKMAHGEMPSDEIIAGVMLLIAGVLLVTPGFVTDAFGLSLLFPTVRAAIAKAAKKHIVINQANASANHFYENQAEQSFNPDNDGNQNDFSQKDSHQSHLHHGNTIDGEFERKE